MTNSLDFNTKSIAQDAYDKLAEEYAARIGTKAHNAYYERPATLSLLPEVKGRRVLDAGCGPGVYAEILVKRGAQVVALDASPKMVALARARLGEAVPVIQASLENPLNFLENESFNLVVAPLVLDYVRDWRAVFGEFQRVLMPGGVLVFSMEHPTMKYLDFLEESNYFQTELVSYTWKGFGLPVEVPSYRRSLAEVFNPLIEAGFVIDRVLEPLPIETFKETEPENYEKLLREPGFLCIRALRR
ncbi:MAG: methyltransferase domain-containing protein [Chloroflexi bacterium]|jgi:ubiquinone/menaquinone biosynthesis C-methylase UbiE|nr:methyltransferase domain-containing protein [Chloroflexota bacterium]